MTAVLPRISEADVRTALDAVVDPELDEAITDLGFVSSVSVHGVDGCDVEVHLRLPTSFCAPNFAWLMVSDARDAVRGVPGVGRVVIELDDHHDSELINRGLAADADYRGTFGHEAEHSLDDLRATFHRKAHTAAMERALTSWVRADPNRTEDDVAAVRLCDLPAGRERDALLDRRAALGLPLAPTSPVLLGPDGRPPSRDAVALTFRKARSVRVSVDGNAHFCRGLLTTRYPGSDADQVFRPSIDHALPLEVLK
ncbi:Metal-sulfur cluster biosynthetic enzyme [Klenkia soli]|uniref:Metal-sulfur cluster biosynthetic enzyme n=1 Tax=Klenkia soli TaxID=1052260 RepID=A0A1H0RRR9_9ACTN|nr:iron-sulfur cluster assembly protein [Klenkia soli]SDP32123.1 Metal-sulfur cluster biosynthetic enzyme [Klenkia soli]